MVTMATTELQPARTPLTASDRCDRCGAQAYAAAMMSAAGSELLFCAHHWREHSDKLLELAIDVHDETSKLVYKPTDV